MPPRSSSRAKSNVAGAPRSCSAVLLRTLPRDLGARDPRANPRIAVRRSVGDLRGTEFGGVIVPQSGFHLDVASAFLGGLHEIRLKPDPTYGAPDPPYHTESKTAKAGHPYASGKRKHNERVGGDDGHVLFTGAIGIRDRI